MGISQFNDHTRRIVISGTIREDTAAVFLEQISALEAYDISRPITVYVDTYGGSVDAALSIYDAMCACSCPIRTIGIGKVMSAGVLVLAAGDKGNRFITQNARVMMHQISGGANGVVKDIEITTKEMKRLQDVFVGLIAKHAGQKKADVLKDIDQDKYFSATEAISYGLVDWIVKTRKPKKNTKLKKNVKKAAKKNKG